MLLINKNLMFSSLLALLVYGIDYGERERGIHNGKTDRWRGCEDRPGARGRELR